MTVTINGSTPCLPRRRPWLRALWRGFLRRCPHCGTGPILSGYLKVADGCSVCGEALHHHRADDAPPYFTILIVGHIVVPLVLVAEKLWQPPLLPHFAFWTVATLALTFLLMPSVKGAIVGLQWALRLHGFGAPHASEEE